MGTAAISIDVALDDLDALSVDTLRDETSFTYSKDGKVDGHDHHSDEPSDDANHASDQASKDSSQGQQASDESNATCNWVQNECIGQGVGSVSPDNGERVAVRCCHNIGWVVSDHFGRAVVAALDAVSEGAKCDGGAIGQRHFHQREIIDDGGRDRGDEKEDRRGEDKEHAKKMDAAKHGGGLAKALLYGLWRRKEVSQVLWSGARE